MKVKVIVIPNSKKPRIEKNGDALLVHVDAPPIKGKANKRLIELLAKYFKTKKSRIRIIHGETAREKIIEVEQG